MIVGQVAGSPHVVKRGGRLQDGKIKGAGDFFFGVAHWCFLSYDGFRVFPAVVAIPVLALLREWRALQCLLGQKVMGRDARNVVDQDFTVRT